VDLSLPADKKVARRHDTGFLESDTTYLCRVSVIEPYSSVTIVRTGLD
jgi:hypothetical protein